VRKFQLLRKLHNGTGLFRLNLVSSLCVHECYSKYFRTHVHTIIYKDLFSIILTLKKASGPSLAVYKKISIKFYIENNSRTSYIFLNLFHLDLLTLNSPGLAFIARVFRTSKGCVSVVATAPY